MLAKLVSPTPSGYQQNLTERIKMQLEIYMPGEMNRSARRIADLPFPSGNVKKVTSESTEIRRAGLAKLAPFKGKHRQH
jgi:hypothetical protein